MLAAVPPKVRTHPAWDEARLQPKPRTLRELDAAVTAPLGGFASAEDYYQRASAYPYLPKITTPTFVIAATDDPLIPVPMIRNALWSASTQVEITRSGGHVGYVGLGKHDQWLEQRIVDWLTR
jgi:hypothetical protein